MTSIWKKAAVFALLAGAGCAVDDANETIDVGNDGTNIGTEAPAQAPSPSAEGTNAANGEQPQATAAAGSILAWSRPAAGSTVTTPINELVLHFSPPARLGEVTVTGPEGAMPMMVNAVGEVDHYSLPLSDAGPGRYTVDWRATAGGVGYRGSFSFEAR